MPWRMAANMTTRMCTESAMARVRMMVGAEADGGVRRMPNQPASPIAVIADRPITSTVPSVPVNERRNRIMATISTPYISGISVLMSFRPASSKVAFITTMPVMATVMSG